MHTNKKYNIKHKVHQSQKISFNIDQIKHIRKYNQSTKKSTLFDNGIIGALKKNDIFKQCKRLYHKTPKNYDMTLQYLDATWQFYQTYQSYISSILICLDLNSYMDFIINLDDHNMYSTKNGDMKKRIFKFITKRTSILDSYEPHKVGHIPVYIEPWLYDILIHSGQEYIDYACHLIFNIHNEDLVSFIYYYDNRMFSFIHYYVEHSMDTIQYITQWLKDNKQNDILLSFVVRYCSDDDVALFIKRIGLRFYSIDPLLHAISKISSVDRIILILSLHLHMIMPTYQSCINKILSLMYRQLCDDMMYSIHWDTYRDADKLKLMIFLGGRSKKYFTHDIHRFYNFMDDLKNTSLLMLMWRTLVLHDLASVNFENDYIIFC